MGALTAKKDDPAGSFTWLLIQLRRIGEGFCVIPDRIASRAFSTHRSIAAESWQPSRVSASTVAAMSTLKSRAHDSSVEKYFSRSIINCVTGRFAR
jgi:hypothetical protein